MANPHIKYYKATFHGIFSSREQAHLPYYQFNQIEWEQLKFENPEPLDFYEAWQEQTSNSWYRRTLKPYKNMILSRQWVWRWPKLISARDFPWIRGVKWQRPVFRKRPHLIIPVNDQFQLQETLHEVILKQIAFVEDGKEWFGGYRRAQGIALFQVHLDPPKKQKPNAAKAQPFVENTIVEGSLNLNDTNAGVTNIWSINQQLQEDAGVVSPIQAPLQMSNKGNRRWRWFVLILLLLCLWKAPALLVPIILVIGAIAFYRYFRKACFGLLISLFLFAIVGYVLMQILPGQGKNQEAVKTEDGNIKISPPKPSDSKDILSEKEITWWDFIRNKFSVSYSTSATSFFESEAAHAEKFEQIQAQSSVEFYRQLYAAMQAFDAPKLDSIVQKFRTKAQNKNLNTQQTAEMVCTFVQEIPYFLVHDFTCRKAVAKSGSDFLTQYHSENKPCLPEIPGGVQSPYEFMHNLKGDCDTRSLLAFTILKELGISASVWISETYGHSVLGVGLPVGSGFYKEVNGRKHYAIELTAKGFRLGMISPEQQIGGNWDIALFYNR